MIRGVEDNAGDLKTRVAIRQVIVRALAEQLTILGESPEAI